MVSTPRPQALGPTPYPLRDGRDTARVVSLVRRLLMVPKEDREARLVLLCPDRRTRREVQDLLQDRRRLRDFLSRLDAEREPAETSSTGGTAAERSLEASLTLPMAAMEPAGAEMSFPILVPPQPEVIGPYRVLLPLGHGGMGVVYLAEQLEPVRRQLAVKLVHRSLSDPVSVVRFAAERQAMARLSHPNIAQIYDAGTTDDGFPYFAMEYVDGGSPITDYCDEHRLTIEERLELFLSVCRGVQHAHQRGIIHRDLKPSNILVAREQEQSIAKVIDFGLAKALDQPLTDNGQLTMGYLAGTPEYMSPESFEDSAGLDVRNDVYSLGIILYELLTGKRPYDTQGMNVMALVHHCLQNDPPAPSLRLGSSDQVLSDVAAARQLQGSALRRRLAGELDYVVLKAVAGDREVRYDSVADLAEDLQRHLRQEPVEAHPPSAGYRWRKFMHRHRMGVVSVSLVILALCVGAIGTTLGMLEANREAEVAKKALAESEELAGFLEDLFQSSEPGHPAQHMTARELLDAGAARIGGGFQDQPEAKARILTTIGDIYRRLALNEPADALLAESLELRRETAGVEHPAYARTLRSLGQLRLSQNQFEAAERNLSKALAVFQEHGMDFQEAQTLYSLGNVASQLGDLEQAEIRFRTSLEIWRSLGDDEHPDIINTLTSLGSLLYRQERFEEAELAIQQASTIAVESLGDADSTRVQILRGLSDIYTHQGRHGEAIDVLLQALATGEAIYGPHHPSVGRTVADLAISYGRAGAKEEAETYYLKAVRIFEAEQNGESTDLAVALNNLGAFYWRTERYEEAEPLYLRALTIQENVFEAGHPSLAQAINNLGLIYWKRGQLDAAESHLQQALEIWERHYGPNHRLVAWPLWGLAGVYRDQQRYGVAEPFYVRALNIRQGALPESRGTLQETLRDYAQLLRSTGRAAEAESLEAQGI